MFAAIGAAIGAVVEAVGGAWEWIKAIKVVGRIAQTIQCVAEWYAYLQMIQLIMKKLTSLKMPADQIKEALGINALFKGMKLEDISSKIAHNLSILEPMIQDARELERRSKLPKSPWAGVHKPPYHSIAISEVLYDYSNVAGTGSMIIMFNPEGFGNKPKPPQIIRYVNEAEFGEFINSTSWGNYWRQNYLLGMRKRNKFRREKQTTDILNENEYPIPKAENLDDYVERVLELPDYADDIIATEFTDLIEQGLDKSVYQSELMSQAIQEGNLGRGVEERGLRVTSVLNDKLQRVPDNLMKLVTTNPVFKDVAKVTSNYKKYISRVRGLRDGLNNSMRLNSLSKEAILIGENFGKISLFGGARISNKDLTFNFLQETGMITNTAGKYNVSKRVEKQVEASVAARKSMGGRYNYDSYVKKMANDERYRQRKWAAEFMGGPEDADRWVHPLEDPEFLAGLKPREQWEAEFAANLKELRDKLLTEELARLGISKFNLASFFTPPTCIPMIM